MVRRIDFAEFLKLRRRFSVVWGMKIGIRNEKLKADQNKQETQREIETQSL
jgi:hypothetical protein